MKLAYTVATPDTADAGMQAMRGELAESFRTLASLGYGGAELMVRDPAELDAGRIRRLAAEHGLAIPAISTGQVNKEDGLTLTDADPSVRAAAVERTKQILEFTAEVGAPQINVGSMRGRLAAGASGREMRAVAEAGISELLEHAADVGVGIAIEPQNRFVVNWLNTPTEVTEWAKGFGRDNLSIVFDSYHVLLEEPSMYASLIRSFPAVSHVQVSDTNRLAPGWGQFNFGELIRSLSALGYERYVSVEIVQRPSSEAAAEAAARMLLPLIEEG